MRDVSCEELCKRVQAGIDVKDNMEHLYLREKGLIEWLAKKHYHDNDYEDLCQVGYLGLDKAAKDYDPTAGCTFSHYAAKRIEWYMVSYMKDCGSVIRIPSYMYDRIKSYKKVLSEYYAAHDESPDSEYLMKELNLNAEQTEDIERVISILTNTVSLDEKASVDDHGDTALTLSDVIADPEDQIELILDDIERKELREVLIEILNSLHGREPEVLRKRYFEGKTCTKCSQELGISAQRVAQVEKRGLNRIRKTKAEVLQPYVNDIAFANGLKDTGLKSFRYHGFESSVERDVIRLERVRKHGNS